MEGFQHPLSVWELFDRTAQTYSEKEAIYDTTRRISYGQLKSEAELVADLLMTLGIGAGDKVAVALPNWIETVTIYLATARMGAILVPINPKYRTLEMKHILNNCNPKVIFVSEEFEHIHFDEIKPFVQQIITVRYEKPGYVSFHELRAKTRGNALPEMTFQVNDTFCILYTSGTTNMPKGALITHRALVQSGMIIAQSMRCTDQDVFLIAAPIFHVFGLGCNLLSAIYCGSRMVLLDKFKARRALELIQEEKVTIQHAVPSMFNLMLKDPDFSQFDLSSLRAGMTGASPCPPEVVRGVRENMGMVLSISYGATETCTVTITDYDDKEDRIYHTVGKVVPGAEVKIVNDLREEVNNGEIGEIACRGFGVMKGYYQLPDQTREVLDEDGWYYTGDLGWMDNEGYIRFVGRKKEIIIRGGFNIYPHEIEDLIKTHPKVIESAVLGLPDPVMGEIACAVVQLRPGESATPEEVIDYLKGRVAPYKLPSKVVFMDELPTTASGKMQKNRLKEKLLQTKNW